MWIRSKIIRILVWIFRKSKFNLKYLLLSLSYLFFKKCKKLMAWFRFQIKDGVGCYKTLRIHRLGFFTLPIFFPSKFFALQKYVASTLVMESFSHAPPIRMHDCLHRYPAIEREGEREREREREIEGDREEREWEWERYIERKIEI